MVSNKKDKTRPKKEKPKAEESESESESDGAESEEEVVESAAARRKRERGRTRECAVASVGVSRACAVRTAGNARAGHRVAVARVQAIDLQAQAISAAERRSSADEPATRIANRAGCDVLQPDGRLL